MSNLFAIFNWLVLPKAISLSKGSWEAHRRSSPPWSSRMRCSWSPGRNDNNKITRQWHDYHNFLMDGIWSCMTWLWLQWTIKNHFFGWMIMIWSCCWWLCIPGVVYVYIYIHPSGAMCFTTFPTAKCRTLCSLLNRFKDALYNMWVWVSPKLVDEHTDKDHGDLTPWQVDDNRYIQYPSIINDIWMIVDIH